MELYKVNRRDFLKATGITAGGLVLGITLPGSLSADDNNNVFHPDVFIHIADNGETTIYCGRAEMGQGVSTSLPP